MRVGIVHFGPAQRSFSKLLKAVAKSLTERGIANDIINIMDTEKKLTAYQYLIFGLEQGKSFSSKINPQVAQSLKNAGILSGKPCYAFLKPKLFFAGKTLLNLMRVLESEGLLIRLSDLIRRANEAEYIASKLVINQE